MNRNANGMSTGMALLCTLGVLLFIGWMIDLGTPKCIKSGCDNDAKDGSSYCYLHDNYTYRYKSSTSYSGSSKSSGSSSTTNSSVTSSGEKSSSTTSNSKKSYSSGSRRGSSGSGGKVWLFYIIALIIGYGINELLGAILLIGMIFWLIVCK